jgi:hypothetical protein
MPLVTAEFLYAGLPDYWQGNGDRWDDDKGCLFAYYGAGTTVRDIIEGAVCDFISGCDCYSLPDDVTEHTIREALLACLTDEGRKDYHSGAVSEFALDYADANGLNLCRGCDARVGGVHDADCDVIAELLEGDEQPFWNPESIGVTYDDCNEDECCDSPMVVFLIRVEICDECGKLAEHHTDEICADCAKKHGYEVPQ